MATVIRSNIGTILLALRAQVMAVTGFPVERVVIDTETGEREADDVNYQREQLVFLRTGGSSPEPGYVGMGRQWAPQRVNLHATVWSRCGLDAQPGYAIGLTDDALGHEKVVASVLDALLTHPPADTSGNWLVQCPLEPGPGSARVRNRRADWMWARSVLDFTFTYAPAVNQARQ